MFNKTLINFRPFFFLAVSLTLGIGAGYSFYFNDIILGAVISLVFLLFNAFVILFSGGKLKAKLFFAIVFLLAFVFGGGAFCLQVDDFANVNLDNHYYTVSGKVTSSRQTDYGQSLTVEKVSIQGDRTGKLEYGINLLVYGESAFDIGDIVQFESRLYDVGVEYEDRLSSTNIERKIKYTATVDADDIKKTNTDISLFEGVNIYIRNSINAGMEQKEGGVAIGLLLGDTDLMNGEVITAYRSAGVAHIFAVSGLHIGFLATALNFLFNKLRANRLFKAIFITLVLFFYSGVCGFSASSLRASVMCAVMLFSSIKGNRYDGLSSIGIAGTIILVFSPINLFCMGFQLSFVVATGIILLSLPLSRLLSFLPKKLADSLGVVLSAQAVGIPVCLYSFNQFSTIAILANLIFVPVVGAIFILLFLTAIIGGLGISNITLFLPNYAFKAINAVITVIDYQSFIVGGFTFGIFAIFYYLALILPCGLINLKSVTKAVASLICVGVCIIGTVVVNYQESLVSKAYVVGDEKICATVIKNQGENIMIISDAEKVFSLSRFNRLLNDGVQSIDSVLFTKSVEDIPAVLTRLNQVFELKEVFYYGEGDIATEQIITKVFGLSARAYKSGERLGALTDCSYSLNGYAVEFVINKKQIAVVSEFGSSFNGYKGLEGDYSYMVATDYVEFIYNEYKPKEFISYREMGQYKDAYSAGTVTLKLE